MQDSTGKPLEISDLDLLRWYRKGRTFQDILKALHTSQLTGIDPGVLLSRAGSERWVEIWEELEISPFI